MNNLSTADAGAKKPIDPTTSYVNALCRLDRDYEDRESRIYEGFLESHSGLPQVIKELIRKSDESHMQTVAVADRTQEAAVVQCGIGDFNRLGELFNDTGKALLDLDAQHFARVTSILSKAYANTSGFGNRKLGLLECYKRECIDRITGKQGLAYQYLTGVMELNEQHGLEAVNALIAPKDGE